LIVEETALLTINEGNALIDCVRRFDQSLPQTRRRKCEMRGDLRKGLRAVAFLSMARIEPVAAAGWSARPRMNDWTNFSHSFRSGEGEMFAIVWM